MANRQRQKHILSKIGDFLSTFIVALVAITAVLLVLVRIMGWHMFSIDSGSMVPRYPVDTLIVVKTTEPEEIEVGDVITFLINENDVLVTHRVTAIDEESRTFTTKGDANNSSDSRPVLWDNVLGKVIFDIPGMGRPLKFITDEGNRPLIIGIIAGLLAVSILWDILARRKRKKRALAEQSEIEAAAVTEPDPPDNTGD